MWPISARCQASLARSGDRTARVDVLRDGQLTERIDSDQPTVRLVGGSIQVDRATIRRSGTVTLLGVGGTLLPDDVNDLLAPLIGELRVWVGVRYWDWTPAEALAGTDWEWIPVGTLVVIGVEQGDQRGEYVVTLLDRMQFLTPFFGNWVITAGTPVQQAITDILASQVPTSHLAMDIPDSEFTTGALLYEDGSSSADAVHALGLSAGLAVYANPMGVIVGRAEPTLDDATVFSYEAGAGSMLVRSHRGVSAADAVNAVVFTGEGTDGPPWRGTAEDTNPLSLTYRPRVGYRPAAAQSSPLIRSDSQAALAARTWLNRNLGLAATLSIDTLPNPAHESGDVIAITDPADGLDTVAIADSFAVDLRVASGPQSIGCRQAVLR